MKPSLPQWAELRMAWMRYAARFADGPREGRADPAQAAEIA